MSVVENRASRAPATTERVMLPAATLLIRDMLARGGREERLRLERAFQSVTNQFINNYQTYTHPDGTVIPYSHVSSDELLTDVFGSIPSPQKRTSETGSPGNGNNLADTVRHAMPDIIGTLDTRQAGIDFYFLGTPSNFGGRISERGLTRLAVEKFSYYGEVHAQLLKDKAISSDHERLKHVSRSMSTYVTPHMAHALDDVPVDQELYLISPPDGGFKTAFGYAVQKGFNKFRNKIDGRPDFSTLNDTFFDQIAPILEAEKGIHDNLTEEEQKLRKRLKRTEKILTLLKRPVDKDHQVTEVDGIYDPLTSSVGKVARYYRHKEDRVHIDGNITVVQLPISHSPRSYSDEFVDRVLTVAKNMPPAGVIVEFAA